jgi:2-methylcitrate dehydratase PrpD
MATCTEVLAEFALKETLQSLPTSVLEKAKLMILDGVGLALAATREDFAQKTTNAMRAFGQGSEATVVGVKDALPVTSAPTQWDARSRV